MAAVVTGEDSSGREISDFITDEEYVNPETARESVKNQGGSYEQQEAAYKGAKTTNYLNESLKRYDQKYKADLDYILGEIFGFNKTKSNDELKYKVSSKQVEGALAFTNQEDMIGAGYDLEERTEKLASQFCNNADDYHYALEVADCYRDTHEKAHTAHPNYVEEFSKVMPLDQAYVFGGLMSETVTELATAAHMLYQKEKAKTPEQKAVWQNAVNEAARRYITYLTVLQNNYGAQIDKKEALEAFKSYAALASYVKELRAKR